MRRVSLLEQYRAAREALKRTVAATESTPDEVRAAGLEAYAAWTRLSREEKAAVLAENVRMEEVPCE